MIKKNIEIIKEKISSVCKSNGRNGNDITILAVSKFSSPEEVAEAKRYGINHFGENKAQELKYKSPLCSNEIIWHFIGHLQTNKVKDVVPVASLIHSVDSFKLATEIDKRARNINKVQDILLEINTSGEESKYGLSEESMIFDLAHSCKNLENINLIGLMTMAPFTSDKNLIRNSFRSLNNFFIKLKKKGFLLKELSMGMSNDYDIAIEEGATIVRIGTSIFGAR